MKLDKREWGTIAPYTIAVIFGAVTVGRVAAYAGTFEAPGYEWIGWPYALAVDMAIAVCALMTKWKTTRVAWLGYFLFTAASGALNVAHVAPWAQGLAWAAWVYALFPTFAIALLGYLARDATKFAKGRKASDADTQPAADVAQGNGHKRYHCEACLTWFSSQNALNAHKRFCKAYQTQKERERERV